MSKREQSKRRQDQSKKAQNKREKSSNPTNDPSTTELQDLEATRDDQADLIGGPARSFTGGRMSLVLDGSQN